MDTTDKDSCRIIVDLLCRHKVRHVVISPGSRNAPLVVALHRCDEIEKHVVIDERCAAFFALGIASQCSDPVALVCTSGSALLNYAPAVSEAYYRKLPLIIISADRPAEWIDQDDSQTIRQFEALTNYVKRSYNIPSDCRSEATKWYVNRSVNDALIMACHGRKSPVHINIQLDEPLNGLARYNGNKERYIEMVSPCESISEIKILELAHVLSTQKVMIIAGFQAPDITLNVALSRLSTCNNVVVLTENISNLHDDRFISSIDRTLYEMSSEEKEVLRPDVVVTLGGALVSRHVKQYLRNIKPLEHWHVGVNDNTIDCFTSLTKRIEINPSKFFTQISDAVDTINVVDNGYARSWQDISLRAKETLAAHLAHTEWSDFKSMEIIYESIPSSWNIQLSNGTAIRYSQLFDTTRFNRVDCNRGVSGIDGCTSTAMGASVMSDCTTLLISGDMSAQYDMGAFAMASIPPRFKMIVINNGGGGIFRFIKSTSDLPEVEKYFAVGTKLPLKCIADGFGFKYFEANDIKSLRIVMRDFIKESDRPAILQVFTPAEYSAKNLKEYFSKK